MNGNAMQGSANASDLPFNLKAQWNPILRDFNPLSPRLETVKHFKSKLAYYTRTFSELS